MQLQPKLHLTWRISATSKNYTKNKHEKLVAGHCFFFLINFVYFKSVNFFRPFVQLTDLKQCFSLEFCVVFREQFWTYMQNRLCSTSSANNERHFQHIVLLFNIFFVLVLLLMNNNRSAQPNKCRVCMHHINIYIQIHIYV